MKRLLLLLSVLIGATVAQADGIANWRVEYYNNQYLIGGDPIETTVNAVSFDWGSGAPAPGVNADNFSARFSTRVDFSAGTYRFFARADDQVRVMVNSQTLFSTFDQARVGEVLSADIQLATGTHQIQVDYREVTGDAYVFVTWENAATNPTTPIFAPITATATTEVNIGPWLTQYFGNEALSGFPSGIFSEPSVTNNWGEGSPFASVPTDNFSARWTAGTVLEQGRYRVTARADDGVRVFIDGDTVIDAWIGDVSELKTADITLGAGQHNFVVEYREDEGDAFIEFTLERIDETQIIPTPVPAVKAPSSSPENVNARGTVDAYRLNVRAAPTTDAAVVIKIERGESYPIIGRNSDDSWWQVDVNGSVGWVFADFLIATNTVGVPVTSSSGSLAPQVTGTGLQLTASGTINLRSRPTRSGAVLGLMPFGASAEIIARNSTSTWIQVDYNGTVAWVSRGFVNVPVPIEDLPLATN